VDSTASEEWLAIVQPLGFEPRRAVKIQVDSIHDLWCDKIVTTMLEMYCTVFCGSPLCIDLSDSCDPFMSSVEHIDVFEITSDVSC
jgi:hypothetical protein